MFVRGGRSWTSRAASNRIVEVFFSFALVSFLLVGWVFFFLFHKGIREERRAVGIGDKRMFGFTGSPPAPFAEGIICCRLYFDCSCCTGVAANVIRIRHITAYTCALHGS